MAVRSLAGPDSPPLTLLQPRHLNITGNLVVRRVNTSWAGPGYIAANTPAAVTDILDADSWRNGFILEQNKLQIIYI